MILYRLYRDEPSTAFRHLGLGEQAVRLADAGRSAARPRAAVHAPRPDWTERFPRIAKALVKLRARPVTLDGEAVLCGEDGIAGFDRLRNHGRPGRGANSQGWHLRLTLTRSRSISAPKGHVRL